MGDPSDPLSLNRYVYCNLDPVNFVDPTGFNAQAIAQAGYSFSLGLGCIPGAQLAAIVAAGVVTGVVAAVLIHDYLVEAKGSNQINDQIKKGKAPKSVDRSDKGKIKGEQDHIHLKDGSALNKSGSWKHGGRKLTNDEKEWLTENGWTLPKE